MLLLPPVVMVAVGVEPKFLLMEPRSGAGQVWVPAGWYGCPSIGQIYITKTPKNVRFIQKPDVLYNELATPKAEFSAELFAEG